MALCLNEQTLAVRPVGRGAGTSPELLEGDSRKKGKCVTAVAETQVLRRARRPSDPHVRIGHDPHLRRRRLRWGGGWRVSGDRNVLKLFGAERRTSRSLRSQTRSSSSRSITSVSVSSLRYSRACSSLAASMFNVLRTFRPIGGVPSIVYVQYAYGIRIPHPGQEKRGSGYNPPMTPRTAAAALLVVLAFAVSVCRPAPAPAPESRAPRERASAVAQQDTAFAGTLAPVQRVRSFRPGVARPVLRHVETRAGASPGGGYDRVLFEFTGDSLPGYRVEYATKPVQRCGSGDPVAPAATARGGGGLIVRFSPAQAHDEPGNLTPAEA